MSFNPSFKTKAIEASRLQSRYLGHRLGPLYEHQCEGDPPHLLGHCTVCGMRVSVDSRTSSLSGQALTNLCDHNALRAVESSAWLIGQIPILLMRRFQQELEHSDESQRELFEQGQFQPGNYALLSRDGVWALRYEIRQNPLEPIADDNRQSATGVVFTEREVEAKAMRWARYCGARINPNGHENEELWEVYPLEHGECGWFYQDREGFHRFRRDNGVVGYYVDARACRLEEKPT
jgi:hypothetical protein